jgi:hypothetical protein
MSIDGFRGSPSDHDDFFIFILFFQKQQLLWPWSKAIKPRLELGEIQGKIVKRLP